MKRCPDDGRVLPDEATRCPCGHRFAKAGNVPKGTLDPDELDDLRKPSVLRTVDPDQARSESRLAKSGRKPKVDRPSVPVLGSPAAAAPFLIRILEGGQDGEAFGIWRDTLVVSRVEGDVNFPEDGLLSKPHARVSQIRERVYLRDLGSKNGTFLRMRDPVTLEDGTECLVGVTTLKWVRSDGWQVKVVRADGKRVAPFPFDKDFTLGRAEADLDLDDEFVSPEHAEVRLEGGEVRLIDRGSVNGVYLRIPAEKDELLHTGDFIRLGRQLFRFELRR